MISYRDATLADGAALNAMALESFTETFAAEYRREDFEEYTARAYGPDGLLRDLADPTIRFRVAEADGRIIGYAKLSNLVIPFDAAKPDACELRQLYVLAAWHGQGVAQVLMDWTIAEARRLGAPELYLAVFEFNHRARAFYARYGFVEVGEFDFRLGDRVDRDRVWQLTL